MGELVAFPTTTRLRPEIDAVRVVYDFSMWCVEHLNTRRMIRRDVFGSRAEALAEAERLHKECGWRRLPDPLPDFSTMIYCHEDRGE